MHGLKVKRVLRFDGTQRKLRLLRIMWQRGKVGDGVGYSAKVAISLAAKLFSWNRDFHEWRLTIAGLQLHYMRSYGGIIV